MKELSTFWFMEHPIDREHKFYVLMDYLQSVEKEFMDNNYIIPMSSLLRIQRDLSSYRDKASISIRSYTRMSDDEKSRYDDLSREFMESPDCDDIIEESIETIDNFLFKFPDIVYNYDDLVKINYTESLGKTWEKGFLVIKNPMESSIRIYSWNFSLITIGGDENLALLMTEILEPVCQYSDNDKEIKKFLIEKLRSQSRFYDDMIIFSTISKGMEADLGIDISKEKAVEAIIKNYRNSLSLL